MIFSKLSIPTGSFFLFLMLIPSRNLQTLAEFILTDKNCFMILLIFII